MSECFHCDLCDRSIKIKSKKKHINSQYHESITWSIICKYTVKNPSFLHVEDLLKKFVDDCNKKFEFYIIFCKWKLLFSDALINVKSDRLYKIHRAGWNLRKNLMSKFENFESNGHNFSHICEMNIVFITDLTNTTNDHYLKISKPKIEWTIIKKLAINPKLIKAFDRNTPHPLIRKYSHIIDDEEI